MYVLFAMLDLQLNKSLLLYYLTYFIYIITSGINIYTQHPNDGKNILVDIICHWSFTQNYRFEIRHSSSR